MFVYQVGNVPVKVWMSEQSYYADSEIQKQAMAISIHPNVFHHLAIMPDGHSGYGMMIGGVAAFKDVICPFGVGMDIGCGLLAVLTDLKADDVRNKELRTEIKDAVKKVIPMGFAHHEGNSHLSWYAKELDTFKMPIPSEILELASRERILGQLGTLGGGNHFQEIQEDELGRLWIMLHSGSRNLGAQVCKKYHAIALKQCEESGVKLPNNDLAVLSINSSEGQSYITAMNYCLQFAMDNRDLMMHNLVKTIGGCVGSEVKVLDQVHIHHNYAALEKHFGEWVYVHRKGATDASKGKFGVIPGSMGTPSYITVGLGNPESFNSCSHGGGRKMSRGSAKKSITLDSFKASMGEVVYDHVQSLLDESPEAYKDIRTVMSDQKDLVETKHSLSPLIAIKSVGCKEE
jgi:tRNA-splicing ligase RtcB